MKTHLLALAALLAFAPAHAQSKKPVHDPALAQTWIADAKAYEGKKITTYVIAIGDTGEVSPDAPYAVVSVTTGTAAGKAGEDIPVLVQPAKLKGFFASLAPKRTGKPGAFGAKIAYAPLTATFVTLQGEPALVVGEVTSETRKTKPSALSDSQHPAKPAASGLYGKRPDENALVPDDAPKKPVR